MAIKDVFISYKAEDYDKAREIKDAIEKKGISCWMAPESIPGGASYASEIPPAIENCKAFVLVMTGNTQKSKWVPRELDKAINANRIIMPLMLENVKLESDFQFYLTNVQHYEAYKRKDEVIKKLIEDIMDIVGIKDEVSDDAENGVDEKEEKPAEKKVVEKKLTEKVPKAKKDDKKPVKILGAIVGAILCIIAFIFIFKSLTTVKICGEKVEKSTSSLYLYQKDIAEKDIEKIGKLKNLTVLSLDSCNITSGNLAQAIDGKNMYYIALPNCGLTDEDLGNIDFSKMELDYINISENQGITSIEKLKDCAETLTTVNIGSTKVNDISVISNFKSLLTFDAEGNGISDISPLANCEKLQILWLTNNEISDLSPLVNCKKLTDIKIGGNKIKSLYGLENAIELSALYANDNEIESLDGISNCTLLKKVYLDNNKLADISILTKSQMALENLFVRNNMISDLSMMNNMQNLKRIAVDNNNITSLSFLSASPELIGVAASGNEIADIAGIENLKKLKYVDLSANKIETVGGENPLTFDADDGAVVDFSSNPIKSINMAYDYTFDFVSFKNCSLEDYSPIYNIKAKNLILDYSDNLDGEALKDVATLSLTILDCPKDKEVALGDAIGKYIVTFENSDGYTYDVYEKMPYDMKTY